MAKQPQQQSAQQPAAYPANWGRMNTAQRRDWMKANRPDRASAPAQPAPAQRPNVSSAPEQSNERDALREVERYDDQGAGNQQLIDQGEAERQIVEQIAQGMGEVDLKRFVATILRGVADILDVDAPVE